MLHVIIFIISSIINHTAHRQPAFVRSRGDSSINLMVIEGVVLSEP